jgi:hypothetical protein
MEHREELASDGYSFYTRKRIGLPVYVWITTLDVEINRLLYPSEQAILGLISCGISQRSSLRELLGLTDDGVFTELFGNVLGSGAVALEANNVVLTDTGRRILASARRYDQHRVENFRVVYNPYWEKLSLPSDSELVLQELRDERGVPLEFDANISAQKLTEELQDLAVLLSDSERITIPSVKDYRVIRVGVQGLYTAYLLEELELWHRTTAPHWSWVLANESAEVITVLRRYEQEQEDKAIIPRVLKPVSKSSRLNDLVEKTFHSLEEGGSPWLDWREAQAHLDTLVASAELNLLFVSAFVEEGENDVVLTALERMNDADNLVVTLILTAAGSPSNEIKQEQLVETWKTNPLYRKRLFIHCVDLRSDSMLALSESSLLVFGQEWREYHRGSNVGVVREGARESVNPDHLTEISNALTSLLKLKT